MVGLPGRPPHLGSWRACPGSPWWPCRSWTLPREQSSRGRAHPQPTLHNDNSKKLETQNGHGLTFHSSVNNKFIEKKRKNIRYIFNFENIFLFVRTITLFLDELREKI